MRYFLAGFITLRYAAFTVCADPGHLRAIIGDGPRHAPGAAVGKGEPVTMKIKLTTIYVDDQDKALAFYTEKLGFQKKAE
jgi:hypothetical protein